MKIVFYKALLKIAKNLTPTERIIYSFLVSKSITLMNDFFDSDGTCLDVVELYSYVDENRWIDLYYINNTQLANILFTSRKTITRAMADLRLKGYIKDNFIYVNKELLEQGYFELLKLSVLSADLSIFYSYLKHKAEYFGGCIDTYKAKLAETCATTINVISKMFNKLYKLNLIKRLDNNKLLVL